MKKTTKIFSFLMALLMILLIWAFFMQAVIHLSLNLEICMKKHMTSSTEIFQTLMK